MVTYASETGNREKSWAAKSNRMVHWLSRHWLLTFNLLFGLIIGLPWLAPIFMKLGWDSFGRALYSLYSLECHQLPERSYFLFGSKMTYSLNEVQAAWQPTNNPLILRQFLGNQEMGWKVAWCERTTWWYGCI
jgi:membrane-anchored protein YejM (alkaline phosphatase superfamily)